MAPTQRGQTLAWIDAALWRELDRAVADRQHAWRTGVLATASVDGRPDARTVILREVDTQGRRLVIYSDARAPKVGQLQRQPEALLVLWSTALGWQLRLRLRVAVQAEGPEVTARWTRLRETPAACNYLTARPPGESLGPGPADSAPEADSAHHFALLVAAVEAVDWLELHPSGHRRALFDASGARWITP